MNELDSTFERLRQKSPREASPACERALLRAFRENRRRRLPGWRYWAAVAACFAVSFGPWFVRHRAPAPRTAEPLLGGFVALPYGQGDVPLEQMVIVRVNVPSRSGDLQADLLIGQDGMARAVRWIR